MGPRNDKHCGNPDAQRCCEEATAPLRRIITFAMLRLRVRSPSAPVRGKQDRGAMRLSTGCMLVYTKCGNAAFPAARGFSGKRLAHGRFLTSRPWTCVAAPARLPGP